MKLLFDQNLSPRLVRQLIDLFPGSAHVKTLGLDCAADLVLWDYARDNHFHIVTKDADFSDRSALMGYPPKVVREDHLHWPALDVDLCIESLEQPDRYPLIYK